MALVINNPATDTRTDTSGTGMILGVIIALLAIVLLAIYGIPAFRRQTGVSSPGTNINVQVPSPSNLNPSTPAPSANPNP